MTPAFEIRADGADITALIGDRLLGLRVTDEARLESDAAEIDLDNRDDLIAAPKRGALISVAIGYRETGLTALGDYSVVALRGEGLPRRLIIVARAAPLEGAIAAPRTRTWTGVSLGGIARSIAASHGLQSRVAPAFNAPVWASVEQQEESDVALLTRLADEAGALATIKGRTLLLLEEGAALTADGEPIPVLEIAAADVSSWSWTIEDREAVAAVRAYWQRLDAASKTAVEVGLDDLGLGERRYRDGGPETAGPIYEIGRIYATEADAVRAARTRLRRFRRASATLSLLLSRARPEAVADGPLTVTGLDAFADGAWRIVRVEHRLGGALTTLIEAERPHQETTDA